MITAESAASLDRLCEQDEGHPEDEADEFGDVEPLTAEELAEIQEAAADELLAVEAATTGRRGPGQPGTARIFPGESSSPAAGFGPGMPLDVLPGCAGLAVAADAAAGEDNGFAGVSEAELVGVVCAWDRVEAHAVARKLAAIAELARRNPAPEDAEFTADEVTHALAESRGRAGDLADLAQTLETRLPGTQAALQDGAVTRVHVHPGQPGRAARQPRGLAAAHPRTRAGPGHHPGIPGHRPLRPPAPGQRPRSRGQAQAPVPDPARHLHQPYLPAGRRPGRLRAQHPL